MKLKSTVNRSAAFALATAAFGFVCMASAMADDAGGKALFQRNCAACHQVDGKGVPAKYGDPKTTPLKYDAKKGSQELDLELTK